jgi:peptidoglycan hydrolase CwlO-like protein
MKRLSKKQALCILNRRKSKLLNENTRLTSQISFTQSKHDKLRHRRDEIVFELNHVNREIEEVTAYETLGVS